jgi:hypothetical protein
MEIAFVVFLGLCFAVALYFLKKEIDKSSPLEEPHRPAPKNKKQEYRPYACVDDSMLVGMVTFMRASGEDTQEVEKELNRRDLYVVSDDDNDVVMVERRDD